MGCDLGSGSLEEGGLAPAFSNFGSRWEKEPGTESSDWAAIMFSLCIFDDNIGAYTRLRWWHCIA